MFNAERRRNAQTCRDHLGEDGVYVRKDGTAVGKVRVIVHRKRSISIPTTNQQRNAALAQSVANVTVFYNIVQPTGFVNVEQPREGDVVTLDDTGEVYRLGGQALLRDEFKTIVPITLIS